MTAVEKNGEARVARSPVPWVLLALWIAWLLALALMAVAESGTRRAAAATDEKKSQGRR